MPIDPSLQPYAFDPNGSLAANKITGEMHVLTGANTPDYFFIVPKFGPYFADSLVLNFRTPQGETRELVEGVDYVTTHWFISASRACAKEIYGSISFLDLKLAGVLTIGYQTLGGIWTIDQQKIAEILADRIHNPRITAWDVVTDIPISFPPIDHEWDLVDLVGMKDVLPYLQALTDAINNRNLDGLALHLNADNPHLITPAGIGTYTAAQIDAMVAAMDAFVALEDHIAAPDPHTQYVKKTVLTATLADYSKTDHTHSYATDVAPGLVEFATNAETITGTDTLLATHPAGVKAAINSAINSLIASAPGALDTLNELASALGNDPNFATTMTNALAGKQAKDATLTALAGLATAADQMIYATGSDAFSMTTLTAYARSMLSGVDAAAVRTTLGLGTSSTKNVGTATGTVAAGDHTHDYAPSTHTHYFLQNGGAYATRDASGNLTATGDVIAFSDENLKMEWATIKDALEKVLSLDGGTFTRIDTKERSAGVIAQAVQKILPEAVREHESGYLTVAYGNLSALFVEAIRDLHKLVVAQGEELAKLKGGV